MAGINPKGTQVLTVDQANALATLKLARHFYMHHKQGAQTIWIWANPESLHKWIFDELKNKTPRAACQILDKVDEIYSASDRRHVAAALNSARLWIGNSITKLARPDDKTLDMVRTWFFDTEGDDDAAKAVAAKLLIGFRRMQSIICSNRLIFSDDPPRRVRGAEDGEHKSDKWKGTRASVAADRGERLDVIYVKGGLLRDLGRDRKEWAVIRTLVHELSHRMIDGTKDVSYRHDGIKPGACADPGGTRSAMLTAGLSLPRTSTERSRMPPAPAITRCRMP